MKKTDHKIKIIVEMTDTGFSAYAVNFPIYTTGGTASELMHNALEASNLYFEDQQIQLSQENIQFEVDFQQFFKYYKVLNANFLAQRIGINPTLLSQYVQGHKKPSPKQSEKILYGIRQIGQELSEINLIYER